VSRKSDVTKHRQEKYEEFMYESKILENKPQIPSDYADPYKDHVIKFCFSGRSMTRMFQG
jgi:hypothetical protein